MNTKQLEQLSDLLGRFYEEVDEGEGQIRYEIGVVRNRVESVLDEQRGVLYKPTAISSSFDREQERRAREQRARERNR